LKNESAIVTITTRVALTACTLLVATATATATPAGGRSIKDFGAAGDGKTDDTAAFEKAAAHGGDLYVAPGTYRIRGVSLSDRTYLHGARCASSIVLTNDGRISVANHCRLSNLHFTTEAKRVEGKSVPEEKGLIVINGKHDVTIDHVRVEDIDCTALYTDHADRLLVTDCHFQKVN
jgi:hypothetical protein